MGNAKKTRLERNWTTFVNPAFCPAWESPLKMVVWNRPRGIRSQGCFCVSPRWGKSKKRVLNAIGRRSSTQLFELLAKAHSKWWYETDLLEFDPKGVFSFRPDGESRKNASWTQLDDVRQPGFLPCLEKPTQNGGMKPTSWNLIPSVFFRFAPMGKVERTRFERNWTTFVNPAFCRAWKSPLKMVLWKRPRGTRSQGCFFVSPRWGKSKKRVLNAIGRRSSTRLFALLGKAHSKWCYETDNVVKIDPNGVFSFRPDGESRKKRVLNAIGWRSSTRLFALLGKAHSKWWYETDLVEFDPKGVFSFRPGGEYRKNAFWTQLDDVRQPGFLPCLEKPTQNGGMKKKKHPWDRIPRGRFHKTILSGLFQAGQKAGLTNVVQLRSKGLFSTFPIRAKRKNTLGIEFHEVGFIPPFWVGFSKQGKKPGWRTSSNCVQNAFFRLSPSGRNEKTPLGLISTRSVSYHHFEWAFPSRAKSRVDERRPIAFKTRFFDFPHRGETKQHPWDRIPLGRFHTTILSGLFQAGQKAGLTNVVQLRSRRVFPTFPIGAKGKNTLGINFHQVGFIPPFWVGFSKQGKKPGWRTSSNCVQNAFFRLSPSGRNEKTPLGSISTRSVSYHHFEWAFPSRAKSRVDERRPIAFKTRFFDFPHRGETKKHPWDRIPRGRFHTTILSGLFQAGQKAGLTNVVQLRSKRVFSTFPIGAKRKNTLGIEFHEVGFIPPFWVGFSKQGKKPGWRTSSNCVQDAFFRLSPSGRNEKTPLGSISTRSVSYHHFEWAFPSRAKSRVDERRPIAFKTRFFDFPHRGETKKHPWDRIPRGRFHTTILSGLFQAGQKAGLTNVVQLRSKRVFSTFPTGAKRKNTLGIEFHEVSFIPQFWVGFSKQGKKPGWRTSSNCVQNAFFRLSPSGRNETTPLGSNSTRSVSYHYFEWAFPSRAKSRVDERRPIAFKSAFSTFPIGAKRKNTLGIEFHEVGFIPPFWVGFSKQGKKPGWRTSSNCVQDALFRLSPSGRNEKTPLGSNSRSSVSYHHFEWAFPSRAKSRVDERRPIAFKTRFSDFPHRGERKKHPWDQFPPGRFHTTILSGLFQAGQKAGLTNVVQLRSKRVFSTFPIGAKRKNTLGIEFHEVGFIPPFWVGFSKQGKKPGWRTSSNCVQNAFFRLSPSGRNEKTPLGSNSTRSVSYHHFEWAFPSRAKSRVDERRPIEFKNAFFRLSPSGRNEKTPLWSISTRSVSYHHFEWAFPSSAKSRVDERRPIAFKTRFFDFPHRGETKKHPWDRFPPGRFHTTILSGLFQAGQKAGLTNVVQLRSKRVFSTFPTGAKRKNTLGIEFHEVGFIPQFWVGFSKQGKKPGWRTSSNCVQNAFFRHSPPGRNEKTPLGSNSTRSVSYHNFEWAFPSRAKSRVDERRPIAFKTRFFDFPHRGETKQHPWDRIPRGRFHTTILSGLFQAGQKAGLTNVVQLRSRRAFSTFPIGAKRKNTLGIEFHEVGFIPPFWVGFSKQGKKPGWRTRPIAFKTRFFDFPHRGETKKHPWDRIPGARFHTTILSGLFQAGQKAGLTNVVQLRSKRVFSTFPFGAKRKNTIGIDFHHVGFIPPFWVCFSKQGKKPGWRTSSNCVQDAFFRLSPSGRKEKTPLGSISTRSVSYHHFEWAFPSRAKSRVDERRPIPFKTRFFDIPHRGETKKHPWDRIPRGRFHTTILSGLFQAGQKAGLTNVVQLRSRRVFPTFPIGAKGKHTLGIDFHQVGFIPPFWVGFSKQGKKPGWRTSSNSVQNAFFRHSPPGRNEKTPLGSNSTRSVSYHHFEWAFPSRAKSRVDERRPIAFKTRFFDFPLRGETKQHHWDRIPRGRFHTTILSGLFQAGQKAGLTNVVQLRSRRAFSTFPIGAKRKNTLGIEFQEVGFIPQFWVGFSKQGKKPGWRTSSNCVQNAFFRLSPSGRNEKTPLGSISTRSVSYHHFEWAFPSRAKRRVEEGHPIAFKTRFFRLSPSWRNEKTPLRSISTRSVSYHHFEWAFPSRAKSRVDERRPIAFKTRFLDFPHRGETKKHPWDRIPLGRFHTTILSGLLQAGQKAGLTNVVQLRSKRVFSTFPIGAKRKNTLGIEFHEVGFIPPFWVGFSKQGKKPGWRTSPNSVQNAFFRLSPSGRNEKTPLGSNSTTSVSYHHFEWAFRSRAKSRVKERHPIGFKTRFFRFSPSGRKEKTPLGSISTRSVSYHHFEWAFPSRAKSRVDERRPITLKTRFFDFPHRGETKKHPWDRIPRGRFHTTILSGLFQAGQKAGLTNVAQFRSKRVFSTFPFGAKRKNTIGIELHYVGFIPPFWVGFSKQGKKPG